MSDPLPIDPEGLARGREAFLEWMRVRHYSGESLRLRGDCLKFFVRWALDRGLARPSEVTKPILERYQRHLFYVRKRNGEPLSLRSQRNHLRSLMAFFKYLAHENRILWNPAADLVVPRLPPQLPKHVLTEEEAERVIGGPDVGTALGVRDRAILETLYSTGIRRSELVGLRLYDLDRDRGTLFVRRGKGGRQRTVPIGERAIAWVERYLDEVRPRFVVPPDEGTLFLTHAGLAFEPNSVSEVVSGYVRSSGIGKRGAAHLFRHSMATLLLEAGADIRFIQAILGHASLESTQIYTQVSIKKLKEVHRAMHPAERRGRAAAEPAPAAPGREDSPTPSDEACAP